MRVEITDNLQITDREAVLLDRHSLLNLFNVLHHGLEDLLKEFPDPGLQQHEDFCVRLLTDLAELNLEEELTFIERQFQGLFSALDVMAEHTPAAAGKSRTLREILLVAFSRLAEFKENRFAWKRVPITQWEANLRQFLDTTERFSNGRFSFSYPPESVPQQGYGVSVSLNTDDGFLCVPPVVQDSLRDLVANARKYSPLGTTISVEIREIEDGILHLSVKDEGMGIPPEEIEKVVQFGYRANNALGVRTMGDGFGLTKAYHVTKRMGGRFFIESIPGRGTTVEIFLYPPSPAGELHAIPA